VEVSYPGAMMPIAARSGRENRSAPQPRRPRRTSPWGQGPPKPSEADRAEGRSGAQPGAEPGHSSGGSRRGARGEAEGGRGVRDAQSGARLVIHPVMIADDHASLRRG